MLTASINLTAEKNADPVVKTYRLDSGQRFAAIVFSPRADVILPGQDSAAADYLRRLGRACMAAAEKLDDEVYQDSIAAVTAKVRDGEGETRDYFVGVGR